MKYSDAEAIIEDVLNILGSNEKLLLEGKSEAKSFFGHIYFSNIFGKNINKLLTNKDDISAYANHQKIKELIGKADNNNYLIDYLLFLEEKYPNLSEDLNQFVRDVASQRVKRSKKKRGRNPDDFLMRNLVICEAIKQAAEHGIPLYSTDNEQAITACSVVDTCLKTKYNIHVNTIQVWKDRIFR